MDSNQTEFELRDRIPDLNRKGRFDSQGLIPEFSSHCITTFLKLILFESSLPFYCSEQVSKYFISEWERFQIVGKNWIRCYGRIQ